MPRSRRVSSAPRPQCLRVRPAGLDRRGQAAAWREFACHSAPHRLNRRHDIAQDPVHRVLVKYSKIAVSQHVHLHCLQFEAKLLRLVLNGDRAVIGQPRLGAYRRVFRNANAYLVAGKLIWPRLQRRQLGIDSGARVLCGIVGPSHPAASILQRVRFPLSLARRPPPAREYCRWKASRLSYFAVDPAAPPNDLPAMS